MFFNIGPLYWHHTAGNTYQLKMGSQSCGLVSDFQVSTSFMLDRRTAPCFLKNWFTEEPVTFSSESCEPHMPIWGERKKFRGDARITVVFGNGDARNAKMPIWLWHRSCALDQHKNTDWIAVHFYSWFFNQDRQHNKDHNFVCTLISIPVMNDRSVRTHCWNCLKAEAHKVLLLSEIKKMKRTSFFLILHLKKFWMLLSGERRARNKKRRERTKNG